MITSRPFQSGLRDLGGYHRFNPSHARAGFGCCDPGQLSAYGATDLSWLDDAIAATAAITTTSINAANAAAQAKKDRAAAAKAGRASVAATPAYQPASPQFQAASTGLPGWALGLGAVVIVGGIGAAVWALRKPAR